jgi:tRNA A-37 threonylcarbamoyl transferase component Bud32
MAEQYEHLKAALADRYLLEAEIGRGGMATVFRARDLKHDRTVAIKVLRSEIAAAVGPERFLLEIRITASLNHPHILPLLDSGETDGLVFYVMPYVEGGSLRRRISHDDPLPLDVVTRVTAQVAAALEYAHHHGIVHRDIKPENILFSEGLAVVADFGVAKAFSSAAQAALTRSGFPMGTIGYMSPEQAAGRTDVDERTDVYGLACVTYEMLLGETPGIWPTEESLRLGRLVDASPDHRERLDRFPGRVEQVLTRALALKPTDRFAAPVAFAEALAEASRGSEKLGDAEVREILERAAELEVEHPTADRALSIGAVEQVAAEVGIPPARVREAAREVQRPPHSGALVRTREPSEEVVLRNNVLVAERLIDGEVPDTAFGALVDEIHACLDIVGHVSTLGSSLTWSPAVPGSEGRKIVVTITPKAGQTRIHIEERLELSGWKMFAPGWGAAGGGLLGLALLSLGAARTGAAVVLMLLLFAVGGAILTARGITKTTADWRRPDLQKLLDRLAALAEEVAEPARGPDGGQGLLPG